MTHVKKDHINIPKVPSSQGQAQNKFYSKTCVKWPLKIRQNKDLNDKW